jgi:S-DNA-T family DNA segregation ATPase FtsK/SpoIIIE
MKIVALDGKDPRDVDVALDGATASVADLARALGLAPAEVGESDAGLVVDGFFAPGDLAIAEAGIHEGAEIRPAGARPADTGPSSESAVASGAAELCVISGLDAGRRVPLTVGSHLVGRGRDCEVVLPAVTVSRQHCRIDIDQIGQAQLTNLSDSGTFVDGQRIAEPVALAPDAVIEIGSVALCVRAPIANDRPGGVDRFRDLSNSGTINFNRPPRFALPDGPAPLSVPKEPDEAHKAPFNVASVVAPAVMGLVSAQHLDDVGVAAEVGGDFPFPLEPAPSRVVRVVGQEHLDRHRAAQFGVKGLIDRA